MRFKSSPGFIVASKNINTEPLSIPLSIICVRPTGLFSLNDHGIESRPLCLSNNPECALKILVFSIEIIGSYSNQIDDSIITDCDVKKIKCRSQYNINFLLQCSPLSLNNCKKYIPLLLLSRLSLNFSLLTCPSCITWPLTLITR
jgi:hypothetical protein